MSKKKSSFREDINHNQKEIKSDNEEDNTNTESADQAVENESAAADPEEQSIAVDEEESMSADKVVSAEEVLEE